MNEAPLRSILSRMGITVTGKSRDWVEAQCPFAPFTHSSGQDRRPSFGVMVNAEGVSGYKCQTCGLHGRVSSLVRMLERYRNVSYPGLAIEADVSDLEIALGDYEIPARARLRPEPLNQFMYQGMFPAAWEVPEARAYLESRNIERAAAVAMQMMYDPDERRVVFPVYGASTNDLFGFTGRAIDPGVSPKVRDYAGLPKRHLLLGEHMIWPNMPLFVVEGLFGWAWLVQEFSDLINVVAILGSEMTIEKAQKIAMINRPTYLVLDNDAGGDTGLFGPPGPDGFRMGGAVNILRAHVPLFVPSWPEGKSDPDELIREDIEHMLETPALS